jgi:hypothetical protein
MLGSTPPTFPTVTWTGSPVGDAGTAEGEAALVPNTVANAATNAMIAEVAILPSHARALPLGSFFWERFLRECFVWECGLSEAVTE